LLFQPTKSTWVTRRVPRDLGVSWGPIELPAVGDVLACEVVAVGLHGRIETVEGTRAKLYPGDRIACVVGNRYATSMLEGLAMVTGETVDLLSASGLCGKVVTRCDASGRPTQLRILGQGRHRGAALNLRPFSLGEATGTSKPVWVVVVGSAMDSGKTTTCASIIHGLCSIGCRVGAAKLTGTASARDVGSFRDAGAAPVYDFLDLGWPSTPGCTLEELHDIVIGLTGHLAAAGVEVGVLEIADGLLQRETAMLLGVLKSWLGPVRLVLAVQESLAGVMGAARLREMGHELVAISGLVTNSPLACQEIELAGAGPCIRTRDLGPELAPRLLRNRPLCVAQRPVSDVA